MKIKEKLRSLFSATKKTPQERVVLSRSLFLKKDLVYLEKSDSFKEKFTLESGFGPELPKVLEHVLEVLRCKRAKKVKS
jgi:hypothetical protein